jgi:hypothetical protein
VIFPSFEYIVSSPRSFFYFSLLHLFSFSTDKKRELSFFYTFAPSQLDILYLDKNSFWGTIPTELQGLQYLRQLSLFQNQLTGTIPTELGLLLNLEVLAIHVNNLEGTLPSSLGKLSKLSKWYIGNAMLLLELTFSFQHSILCFVNGSPIYFSSTLSSNNFLVSGYLNVGSTKITGIIPSDLCTMQPVPLSTLIVPCNVKGCYTQCT